MSFMTTTFASLTFDERNCWLFSLSGFASLSTQITTRREIRLSLIFLLSENNQRVLITV